MQLLFKNSYCIDKGYPKTNLASTNYLVFNNCYQIMKFISNERVGAFTVRLVAANKLVVGDDDKRVNFWI